MLHRLVASQVKGQLSRRVMKWLITLLALLMSVTAVTLCRYDRYAQAVAWVTSADLKRVLTDRNTREKIRHTDAEFAKNFFLTTPISYIERCLLRVRLTAHFRGTPTPTALPARRQ